MKPFKRRIWGAGKRGIIFYIPQFIKHQTSRLEGGLEVSVNVHQSEDTNFIELSWPIEEEEEVKA